MKVKPIPAIPAICKQDFANYLSKPTCPLVLTDMMSDWPAINTWSFDYFSDKFNHFPVTAYAPQFPSLAICGVKTTLGRYIAYLKNPAQAQIEGTWIKGDPELLKASGLTLYAGNFNPAHPVHGLPELIFQDVPQLPDFIESWRNLLPTWLIQQCEQLQSHHFVYLSAAGGITPLHEDFWGTHAFLAQISGKKEAWLFAPDAAGMLYLDADGNVPQMRQDPRFANIVAWQTTLKKGDLLIIPGGWLHYVETLEPSITYSADWIDANNWQQYLNDGRKALAKRGKLA